MPFVVPKLSLRNDVDDKTADGNLRPGLTTTWLILLCATFVMFALATRLPGLQNRSLTLGSITLIAFAKMALIAERFMQLSTAPASWRGGIAGLLLITAAAVSYLLVQQ